jgi:O-succinylbenzoic acid--CoA ligase
VSPSEVEAVLLEHPGVADVGVTGGPDPEWGERVVAVVQPTYWAAPPDVESLRSFAADALEPAALPREVVLLGLLPVLASGKPDKAAVRTLLRDRS